MTASTYTPRMIYNLDGTTRAADRLRILRDHAQRHGSADWRALRAVTTVKDWAMYCGAGLSAGRDADGTPVWYTFDNQTFPREKYHAQNGYYANNYGDTIDPVTALLPARNGQTRAIAGVHTSDNGETTWYPEVYPAAEHYTARADALRAAKEHARIAAGYRYADAERFDAMIRAQDEAEDLELPAAQAIALRNNRRFPRRRETAREQIQALREARERRREAEDAYNAG